jgi:DNA-binding MarR family transcriptional regulator
MAVQMKPDEKEQGEICNYILAYLYDNPDAGDTFEGIVEWWVLRQRLKFETRNVSEAVKKLVSEGLIEEHEEAHSNIFRVNRAKERIIRNMLTQRK